MKQEEFDLRIQQKLEELNPSFNEQDWTRLSGKMAAQKSRFYVKKRHLLLLLLLLLCVLYGTWMGFGVSSGNQYNSEPKRSEEIILAENTKSTQSSNLPMTSQKNVSNPQLVLSESINNTQINSNHISPITEANSQKKISHTVNSIANHVSDNALNVVQETTGNTISSSLPNNVVPSEESDKLKTAEYQEISNSDKLLSDQILEPLALKTYDLKTNKNPGAVNLKLKAREGVKPAKWMIGLTGLITNAHLNTGIAFEIKTKKNISFGAGLVLQDYFSQSYRDQKDFNDSNDGEFSELIRPRHSKAISFTNIQLKSMDVLLPLQLKYYIPLNLRYSIFTSASMNLTLYSNTSLDFKYMEYDTPGQLVESDFYQPSNAATLINHFNLSTGIQREFNRLTCQLSIHYLKNNNNQPHIEKQEHAVQLGILYKL